MCRSLVLDAIETGAHFSAVTFRLDSPLNVPLLPIAQYTPEYTEYMLSVSRSKRKELGKQLQSASPWDIDTVRSLLSRGANPNTSPKGDVVSPLYRAASSGALQTINLLLDYGASIDANGGPFETALKGAIVAGNYDAVVLLLNRGADIDHRHGIHMTPLGMAFHHNQFAIARLLIERGADPNKKLIRGSTSPLAEVISNKLCKEHEREPNQSCQKCRERDEWKVIAQELVEHSAEGSIREGSENLANGKGDLFHCEKCGKSAHYCKCGDRISTMFGYGSFGVLSILGASLV